VGSLLVQASAGRDLLYQPALRRDLSGPFALASLVFRRGVDMVRIRRRFRSGGFSHLHVHYGYFASLTPGLPYSLHLHGGDLLMDLNGGLKTRLTLAAIARAMRVIVSTPNLLPIARQFRNDAVYIPNPMTIPDWQPHQVIRSAPHIMLLSKMDPLKGWPVQIGVIRALRERLPGLTFSFCSDGQLAGPVRAAMTRELVAIGGQPRAFMSREAFVAQVTSSDFALGQLELGALGMSELEAMAVALPTIADASAHFNLGYRPVVIPPAEAVEAVCNLWNAGRAGRDAFGARGREYVVDVHRPDTSLEALTACLAGSVVVNSPVPQPS
jgi:glycosyltransferase involved in cell wall biosynthesis